MRKLFLSIIALTLGIGAWAQETQSVDYIDADGQEKTVTATVVTNETGTLSAGWYVVTGEVSRGSITCNGAVHLILADEAKLTATGGDRQAGIQVSGEGNSLTIYGQDAQSGFLVATGGNHGAGIGGGNSGSGSNITINGGMVAATGGESAAGIGGGWLSSGSNITINGGTVRAIGGESAAGIGGGWRSSGSNITINGGRVTANGGTWGAGIGGGEDGSGSNITINGGTVTAIGEYSSGIGGGSGGSGSDIFMPDNYRIKADGSFIHYDGTDLAGSLAGKQNVEAYPDGFLNERNAAFAAINAAVEGIADETILAMAAAGMEDVFQAEGSGDIEASKQKAISDLQYVISFYNSGKAAGKTDALGPLGEEQPGPAVKVTKGDKEVILYLPDKVEYIIRK